MKSSPLQKTPLALEAELKAKKLAWLAVKKHLVVWFRRTRSSKPR